MASIQDQCCPDPSLSVIPEDDEVRPIRKYLHGWYYSQYGYVVALFFTQGIMKGLFGFMNVWIAYLCFSTLSFCQCFFYLFILIIELVFCSLMAVAREAPFNIVLWIMVAYNLIGIILMYKAYGLFQKKQAAMMGSYGD